MYHSKAHPTQVAFHLLRSTELSKAMEMFPVFIRSHRQLLDLLSHFCFILDYVTFFSNAYMALGDLWEQVVDTFRDKVLGSWHRKDVGLQLCPLEWHQSEGITVSTSARHDVCSEADPLVILSSGFPQLPVPMVPKASFVFQHIPNN